MEIQNMLKRIIADNGNFVSKEKAEECQKELDKELLILKEANSALGRLARDKDNDRTLFRDKLVKTMKIIMAFLEDMDESSCTCGAETGSDTSHLTSGCYYHEAKALFK